MFACWGLQKTLGNGSSGGSGSALSPAPLLGPLGPLSGGISSFKISHGKLCIEEITVAKIRDTQFDSRSKIFE